MNALSRRQFLKLMLAAGVLAGCRANPPGAPSATPSPASTPTSPPGAGAAPNPNRQPGHSLISPVEKPDKWMLWSSGTQLRGANTWQRIVVPELDGSEFLGSGHVGPPYTQEDFNELAALGANYVNLSHPGLFTEQPPYILDEAVQHNLDTLLTLAGNAGLYAVISFRTGPGRSDFTFYRDSAGDWFDPSLLVEHVWTDTAAQQAWAEMWRHAAQRYRDHPVVAGYDLMCEPNGEALLDLWDPESFQAQFKGSLYDWNQFHPQLSAAIRQVDESTPILTAAQGWSSLPWLPYLEPTGDAHTVYTFHQYAPQEAYTHQAPEGMNSYPGEFDLDWDGKPDRFDRAWLAASLQPVKEFQQRHGVPLAVNEFGVHRWVAGAAQFLADEMALFEELGMNHALWVWDPAWQMWNEQVDDFNFRHGADANNHTDTPQPQALMQAVLESWSRNKLHPQPELAR